MSVYVSTEVWRHSRQSRSHLLVLLALADWADNDGYAFPAVDTLAKKCRLRSRRHLQKILTDLVRAGELQITRQKRSDGFDTSNLYEVQTDYSPSSLLAWQSAAAEVLELRRTREQVWTVEYEARIPRKRR